MSRLESGPFPHPQGEWGAKKTLSSTLIGELDARLYLIQIYSILMVRPAHPPTPTEGWISHAIVLRLAICLYKWWSACSIVFKEMSLVLIARPPSSAHPWGNERICTPLLLGFCLALCFHWFVIVLGQSPPPPHTQRVCGERKSSGILCLEVGLLDRV